MHLRHKACRWLINSGCCYKNDKENAEETTSANDHDFCSRYHAADQYLCDKLLIRCTDADIWGYQSCDFLTKGNQRKVGDKK